MHPPGEAICRAVIAASNGATDDGVDRPGAPEVGALATEVLRCSASEFDDSRVTKVCFPAGIACPLV